MINAFRVCPLAVIIFVSGCSVDMVKRTAYETLQQVRQQACIKKLSQGCEQTVSYDDYERRRRELESSE